MRRSLQAAAAAAAASTLEQSTKPKIVYTETPKDHPTHDDALFGRVQGMWLDDVQEDPKDSFVSLENLERRNVLLAYGADSRTGFLHENEDRLSVACWGFSQDTDKIGNDLYVNVDNLNRPIQHMHKKASVTPVIDSTILDDRCISQSSSTDSGVQHQNSTGHFTPCSHDLHPKNSKCPHVASTDSVPGKQRQNLCVFKENGVECHLPDIAVHNLRVEVPGVSLKSNLGGMPADKSSGASLASQRNASNNTVNQGEKNCSSCTLSSSTHPSFGDVDHLHSLEDAIRDAVTYGCGTYTQFLHPGTQKFPYKYKFKSGMCEGVGVSSSLVQTDLHGLKADTKRKQCPLATLSAQYPCFLFTICDGHDTFTAAEFTARVLPMMIYKYIPPSVAVRHSGAVPLAARNAFVELDAQFQRRCVALKKSSGWQCTSGSCAISALVQGPHIYTFNLGDCGALFISIDVTAGALFKSNKAARSIFHLGKSHFGGTPKGGPSNSTLLVPVANMHISLSSPDLLASSMQANQKLASRLEMQYFSVTEFTPRESDDIHQFPHPFTYAQYNTQQNSPSQRLKRLPTGLSAASSASGGLKPGNKLGDNPVLNFDPASKRAFSPSPAPVSHEKYHEPHTPFQFTWLSRPLRASNPHEKSRLEGLHVNVVDGRIHGVLEPTRTIGDFELKGSTPSGAISNIPEIGHYQVDKPGFLILGTDGLWDHIQPNDIIACLQSVKSIWKVIDGAFAQELKRISEHEKRADAVEKMHESTPKPDPPTRADNKSNPGMIESGKRTLSFSNLFKRHSSNVLTESKKSDLESNPDESWAEAGRMDNLLGNIPPAKISKLCQLLASKARRNGIDDCTVLGAFVQPYNNS